MIGVREGECPRFFFLSLVFFVFAAVVGCCFWIPLSLLLFTLARVQHVAHTAMMMMVTTLWRKKYPHLYLNPHS